MLQKALLYELAFGLTKYLTEYLQLAACKVMGGRSTEIHVIGPLKNVLFDGKCRHLFQSLSCNTQFCNIFSPFNSLIIERLANIALL